MATENRSDNGIPFKIGALPGGAKREETWADANQAKDETLLLRSVRRSAGAEGMEIRHSDYGYALIGSDRKSVNGRHDMSLKEIESWFKTERGR